MAMVSFYLSYSHVDAALTNVYFQRMVLVATTLAVMMAASK